MRPELPTGTVTFLFTDIEGSTRLLHALGPEPYAEALAEHRRLLRKAFVAHGGVEVDTQGDAFFVAFPTAQGAADAARMGHAALAASPMRVRIGLHTGVPTLAEEGYVGTDVHRGARIAASAHGGQTIVSPTTAALLDGGDELLDLGPHRLKDFDGPVHLHQQGAGSFAPVRTPGSVDLPTPATPFLGREAELFDAVGVVLDHDPRVLTIVGPGGTGKTRFAIELARLLAEEAHGGTVFVPLAPVGEAELIIPAVAQALGASAASPEPIAAALGGRRTHVLLDNLEHLLPAAAEFVASLLQAAPQLRLLVTSRETLRVQGEEEFDLPPLAEDEAIELFTTRARSVRAELERTKTVKSSAGGSIGCRLRSSSRPRARSCSRPTRCSNGSAVDSTYCEQRVTPIRVTRPCAPRSRGATTCCRRPSNGFSGNCRSSPRAVRWRAPRPSARPTWPSSSRYSTRASCAAGPGGSVRIASSCSRRFASSRPSGWTKRARPRPCAAVTRNECSQSRNRHTSLWKRASASSLSAMSSCSRSGTICAQPSIGRPSTLCGSASSWYWRSKTSGPPGGLTRGRGG